MRTFFTSLALVQGLFSSIAQAAPPVAPGSYDLLPRASTCNTPSNRACWTNGFNITTDYETSVPLTGVTRPYTLTITEVDDWVGPDGVTKSKVMLVNNQLPGPVITADWGDRITVTVVNKLQTNGTSMHWHGLRQLNSNLQDGVNGLTECPIPPGASKTYSFIASQYGTTWYHSHFSAQYGNGVWGTIQINGPASLPYDIDLGTFPINDYYYATADELVALTMNAGPPASDNVLFNGTNINPKTGQGKYANVTLTPGKRHRLRLINTSVENHFILSLANHTMTIIAADLVPVNAQTVSSLFIGVGQRYDVTIDASQAVDNYWFNATFATSGACGSSLNPAPAAIFHYAGASGGTPGNPGQVASQAVCTDLSNLTPVVKRTVSTSDVNPGELDVDLIIGTNPLFTWEVNSIPINVSWNQPVDQDVIQGTPIPTSDNIVSVNGTNATWAYWYLNNQNPLPHPFHLHGHDFVLLARSDPSIANPPAFSPTTTELNGSNPTRRDVTMLPANGWAVIAFLTDNPGAWLMHCHIAWHISGGLGLTFLERAADFRAAVPSADVAALNSNCAAWNAYYPSRDPDTKQDSGV